MKKIFITLAVVLAVADAIGLYVYWQHQKEAAVSTAPGLEAGPAPAPASTEPVPLPSNAMTPREDGASASAPGGARTPGGCGSPAECDQYCADPANRQECMDFIGAVEPSKPEPAKAADTVMSGNDEERLTRQRVSTDVRSAPRSAQNCVKKRLGAKTFAVLLKEGMRVTPRIERSVNLCLNASRTKEEPPTNDIPMGGAPEGCVDMASCTQVCTDPANREACLAWKGLPAQFRTMLEGQDGGGGGDDE
ncbi:MAG: hypothetical protein HYZ75_01330 [Elusimicrobia bacterium]|nr:hypothetical protein [Elusimicrobiota bacterium]